MTVKHFHPLRYPYVYLETGPSHIAIPITQTMHIIESQEEIEYGSEPKYLLEKTGRYIPGYGWEYTFPWMKGD